MFFALTEPCDKGACVRYVCCRSGRVRQSWSYTTERMDDRHCRTQPQWRLAYCRRADRCQR